MDAQANVKCSVQSAWGRGEARFIDQFRVVESFQTLHASLHQKSRKFDFGTDKKTEKKEDFLLRPRVGGHNTSAQSAVSVQK